MIRYLLLGVVFVGCSAGTDIDRVTGPRSITILYEGAEFDCAVDSDGELYCPRGTPFAGTGTDGHNE